MSSIMLGKWGAISLVLLGLADQTAGHLSNSSFTAVCGVAIALLRLCQLEFRNGLTSTTKRPKRKPKKR